jgi:hypothetical protein
MNLNDRERHLLARSLFRFNVFLADEFNKAHEKRDEKESKKNVKIMQEITALFEKLNLTDDDMKDVSFDGTKYYYRFPEDKS